MYTLLPSRRHALCRPGSDNFIRSFFDITDTLRPSAFRVDVQEEGEQYKLEAEMPGVSKEEIQLSVENECLTISADVNHTKKEQRESYLYSERYSGHMARSFNMEGIDTDAIEASYENGLLTVILPKQKAGEENQARKIIIA